MVIRVGALVLGVFMDLFTSLVRRNAINTYLVDIDVLDTVLLHVYPVKIIANINVNINHVRHKKKKVSVANLAISVWKNASLSVSLNSFLIRNCAVSPGRTCLAHGDALNN